MCAEYATGFFDEGGSLVAGVVINASADYKYSQCQKRTKWIIKKKYIAEKNYFSNGELKFFGPFRNHPTTGLYCRPPSYYYYSYTYRKKGVEATTRRITPGHGWLTLFTRLTPLSDKNALSFEKNHFYYIQISLFYATKCKFSLCPFSYYVKDITAKVYFFFVSYLR